MEMKPGAAITLGPRWIWKHHVEFVTPRVCFSGPSCSCCRFHTTVGGDVNKRSNVPTKQRRKKTRSRQTLMYTTQEFKYYKVFSEGGKASDLWTQRAVTNYVAISDKWGTLLIPLLPNTFTQKPKMFIYCKKITLKHRLNICSFKVPKQRDHQCDSLLQSD